MIRILVVDDHPVVREGLVAVLEDQEDFEVLGSAASAEEAIGWVQRTAPDIILMDLELPGASGIDAIPDVLRAAPHSQVIVFTAYDTEERVLGALRAGANGYLLKGASAQEIARAIRTVQGGGSYLEPRAAAWVVAHMGAPKGTGSLTARETEVLRLVAGGLSNKQIARSLSITESTVKFHLTSIFTRLGADNRAQAVALAVEKGIL